MANLKLDPITVNTELAENYLKKYNNFNNWPETNKFWYVKKYPEDKVEYDIENHEKYMYNQQKMGTIAKDPYKALQFVKKIQEHGTLFHQLEYLIRKTDETDVKNNLTLICQYLQCDNSCNFDSVDQLFIYMNESTPLFVLGMVAAVQLDINITIVSSQKMASICHLFTDLCAQVGWTIHLVFTVDCNGFIKEKVSYIYEIDADNTVCQCTGVVTESADIESAVDYFIDSSVTAPWRLQRIYVQESVYEEVKDALAAKCSREVERSCADAFAANGKLFVCEALGASVAGEASRVPLEAYRTARELGALLQRHSSPALSLWASDSQLAHEVALASPSVLVWLNDYGSFHGSPSSSLPVYEQILNAFEYEYNETFVKNLKSRWCEWKKLTKNERLEIILKTLRESKQVSTSETDSFELIAALQNGTLKGQGDSSVSVEDGKMSICIQRPAVFEDIIDAEAGGHSVVANYINAAVNGSALFGVGADISFLQSLEQAGVPVLWDSVASQPHVPLKQNIIKKKLKVIRSNFGTIFAN